MMFQAPAVFTFGACFGNQSFLTAQKRRCQPFSAIPCFHCAEEEVSAISDEGLQNEVLMMQGCMEASYEVCVSMRVLCVCVCVFKRRVFACIT